MAAAFVQATTKVNGPDDTVVTTGAFGSQPVIGNFVIVIAAVGAGASDPGTFTFTDNQATGGNSYTTSVTGPNVTGNGRCAIGVARITKSSGAFTVTCTTTNSGFSLLQAWEISGLKSIANPTDQSNTAGPTTSTTVSSGAVTPTLANEFIVAAFTDNGGSNDAISAPSGAGWVGQLEEENGASFQRGAGAYRIATTIQSESTTWTITSHNWGGAIASFFSEPPPVTDNLPAIGGRTIFRVSPQRWG